MLTPDTVQAGVNVDQMGDGLGDFAAKVAEASAGAGPLAQIFKANGVELKNQNGTLRSTRDILGDFADLIKNAQTPAEQLFLAQQAFGDEAAKMVPLFKDGARGIEQLEVNAKAAGGVIDADLVKRAEELDRRFQSMWQTFSARSASAVLTAVQAMDGLLAKLRDYEQRKAAADLGTLAGSLVQPKGAVLTPGKSDKPNALDARMAGTLAASLSDADQKLVDALKARYGEAAAKATVIPSSGTGSGGGGGNGSMKEKLDLAERVIETLEHERSLIGLTGVELEKANALWAAGKDATAAQRSEIELLVESIYKQSEALDRANEAMQEMADIGRDAVGGLVHDLLDGKDAADSFADALKRIGDRLLDSALDSLFSGFGKSGGGFLSFLGIPGFASGTRHAPGGLALVGERGPELVNLPRGSQVMPNGQTMAALRNMPSIAKGGGGGSQQVNINVNVTGANGDQHVIDLVRQGVSQGIRQYDQGTQGRVVAAMRDARRRNVNF